MLKSFKKSMIVLFSCISINMISSAATQSVTPKRSSEYLSQSSRALSSPYSTVADVAVSGNLATVKETGQPFTGTYVEFNQSGNAQVVRNFQNGTLNGPMFLYYENGNIQKVVNYVNGVRNGEDIDFYGNGNSKVLRNYQNGLLNGKSFEFDEFGHLTSSLEYVNNAKNGKEIKSIF